MELQKRFGPKNFTVVAVNADRLLELDQTDADRAAYVKKAGFTFPVGHLTAKMQQDFGSVNVFPTLFLVNAKGVVERYYVNYQTLDTLATDIAQVLQRETISP